MSITYLTNELLEKKILFENKNTGNNGFTKNPAGRKTKLLTINPDSLYAIGIYIARDFLYFSISNIVGQIIDNEKIKLNEKTTKSYLFEIMEEQVQKLLDMHKNKNILGLGVASIGLVDIKKGALMSSTDFYGISDFNIKELLENRFNLPVFVVEDMKAACLAESFYGAARHFSDFIYLGITRGIGSGIIINDKLFEGTQGFSGEFGHTTLYSKGKKCDCGNTGCMELYLSVPVILKKSGLDTWEQFVLLCENDVTNKYLTQFIRDLGTALVNIINIFGPQAIIIGHEGALMNRYFFEKLQIYVDECAITRKYTKVVVLPSMLNNMPYISTSAVVFSYLFQGVLQI